VQSQPSVTETEFESTLGHATLAQLPFIRRRGENINLTLATPKRFWIGVGAIRLRHPVPI